jgi:large subunit ribosomal protein L22
MGARKRNRANRLKEERQNKYYAVLRNCPTSPRKMRLVVDMIRGEEVNRALDILRYSSKEASGKVEKLLLSAIANWQNKNEGARIEESDLYVKEAYVDQSRTLKRIQPAPQGRAHRIRKRSNHVTIVLGSRQEAEVEEKEQEQENLA